MITRSKKYAEYIKEHPSYAMMEQTFYEFPNGYGASVIHGEYSYGLEAAVIRWHNNTWEFDYNTRVAHGVMRYIDDLDEVLEQIYNLYSL
jgi:hypothetical protein